MGSVLESVAVVFSIIKNIIVVFGIFQFTVPSGKKKYCIIPCYITAILYTWFTGTFSVIVDVGICLFTLGLLCDIKIKKCIKVFSIQFLMVSFFDLLIWLIVVGITPLGAKYEVNESSIYMLTSALGIVLWLGISFYFKNRDIQMGKAIMKMKRLNYLLLLIGIGSMSFLVACIQGAFWDEMTVSIQRSAMIVGVVFAVLVVLFFGWFLKVEEARKNLEVINQLKEANLHFQEDYYEKRIRAYEDLRAFRHDVKKHYGALTTLLADGRIDEAKEYLEQLIEKRNELTVFQTGNVIADSFINAKYEALKELDVQFSVIGRFPEKLEIDNTSLSVVLGNILDNAEEALRQVEGQKELAIEIRNYMGRLYLTVINTSNPVDVLRLDTTKDDKERHGYGLENVKNVVKQYGGSIEFNYVNSKFITNIYI